jgi:predicted short-subunit dehydrogenase-like oxidoreductase (DUF2520 family)
MPDARGALLEEITVAIVGRGRLGPALAQALAEAGVPVVGPVGRDLEIAGADVVVLCVPDSAIASVAQRLPRGPLVGHCSGATPLTALDGHEAFSIHPLTTVTAAGARFDGVSAAVAGSTPRARRVAEAIATSLRMLPMHVAEEDRPAYHAAATVAANFLVTLGWAAERLAESAGVPRSALGPVARAALENWLALGPERALTGPIARGDEATVARQRRAVEDRAPDLLELFDAMTATTRRLAGREHHLTLLEGR